MHFEEDFFLPETRRGFELTPTHKRIWQIQLEMAQLLDDICKRHSIPYWMDYGTLLGAVREKGYIPWDIDLDFCMMRKDYARFIDVAPPEIPDGYSFQTDFLHYDMVKLKNDSTTALYFPLMDPKISQGLYIDIAPLDDIPEGTERQNITDMMHEMLLVMHNPELILKYVNERGGSALPMDFIRQLLRTDPDEVQREYQLFCLSNADKSPLIADIYEYILHKEIRQRAWYEKTVMLSFENTSFPAPYMFDKVLTVQYGQNYMTPVQRKSEVEDMIFDPEVPYTEYLKGGAYYDPAYWIELGRIRPEEA